MERVYDECILHLRVVKATILKDGRAVQMKQMEQIFLVQNKRLGYSYVIQRIMHILLCSSVNL